MDLNGLNWCFFPIQSLYPIHNGKFCGICYLRCSLFLTKTYKIFN